MASRDAPARRLTTRLVRGRKPPYSTWTFLVVPAELAKAWGKGSHAVRGTLAGAPFRGTASRGEGQLRVPLRRELRERAGVAAGDTVEVTLELDDTPRPVEIPDELRDVLRDDPEAGRLFERLPPSLRRAWAEHVAGAQRAETRLRRARRAPRGIREREYPR